MPTATTPSHRERVEVATREAHLRVLLEALNDWLKDPQNSKRRKVLTRTLDKYRDGAGRLFQVLKAPSVARHGASRPPPGEMEAAIQLLSLLPKKPDLSPPWQ